MQSDSTSEDGELEEHLESLSLLYAQKAVDAYLYEKGYQRDQWRKMTQEELNNELWNMSLDIRIFSEKYSKQ